MAHNTYPITDETKIDIISPHFDDAVYSAYSALSPHSRVITLFGGYPADGQPSPWDISCGFNSSRQAIEARMDENERALRLTGAVAINLSFLDAQFRPEETLSAAAIAEAIAGVVRPDSLILAPSGYSFGFRHRDHVLTRNAAKLLMGDGRQFVYYADIPYCLQPDKLDNWPDQLSEAEVSDALGMDVRTVSYALTERQQQDKKAAVRMYVSQFARNNEVSGRVLDEPQAYRWEGLIVPDGLENTL